jgi:hypothetical protein
LCFRVEANKIAKLEEKSMKFVTVLATALFLIFNCHLSYSDQVKINLVDLAQHSFGAMNRPEFLKLKDTPEEFAKALFKKASESCSAYRLEIDPTFLDQLKDPVERGKVCDHVDIRVNLSSLSQNLNQSGMLVTTNLVLFYMSYLTRTQPEMATNFRNDANFLQKHWIDIFAAGTTVATAYAFWDMIHGRTVYWFKNIPCLLDEELLKEDRYLSRQYHKMKVRELLRNAGLPEWE